LLAPTGALWKVENVSTERWEACCSAGYSKLQGSMEYIKDRFVYSSGLDAWKGVQIYSSLPNSTCCLGDIVNIWRVSTVCLHTIDVAISERSLPQLDSCSRAFALHRGIIITRSLYNPPPKATENLGIFPVPSF
jgi:hypothetical protein